MTMGSMGYPRNAQPGVYGAMSGRGMGSVAAAQDKGAREDAAGGWDVGKGVNAHALP